jgi:AcrR family transcriptional regulator
MSARTDRGNARTAERAAATTKRESGSGTAKGRERAAHLGPERRRPLVLDAALGLFVERGYEGTSMDAIAEAAGVTKPVVYACYPGKAELFEALLRREEERVLGEIQDALPAAGELADPESVLVEGFTAFLRAVAASPDAYRVIFLGEGGVNAAVARRVRRGREMQVDAVTSLARGWLEGRETGMELETAARLIGYSVVGLAESGARALLSEPGSWTPETLGRTLGRLAVHGQEAIATR